MSITAFVEQVSPGQFRASITQPISLVAEGDTRAKALARLGELAENRLSQGEIVEIPSSIDHPWAKYSGIWKDHPEFDAYQADIAKYRASADAAGSP